VPLFGNIISSPSSPLAGSKVSIFAHVYHAYNNVTEVFLEYSTDASSLFQRVEMSKDDLYTAAFIFPMQAKKVFYKIVAQDVDGNTVNSPLLVLAAMDQQPGEHTLTIRTIGNGTTTPSSGVHTFTSGSAIDITATAAPGWRFLSWMLKETEYNQPVMQIIIGEDTEITATFEESTASFPVKDSPAAIYPNPFTDQIILATSHTIRTIIFYDLSGTIQLSIDNPLAVINTSALPAGLFLIAIINDKGDREIVKRFKITPSR
jgi:hypothetical protein